MAHSRKENTLGTDLRDLEEPRTYCESRMEAAELFHVGAGTVAAFTTPCPSPEGRINEDSLAVIPVDADSCILAVADGVGGAKAGAQASRIAVEALVSHVRSFLKGELSRQDAILQAIELANENVKKLGLGAATTLALVEVEGDRVRPYHVGDSCILVVGQQGKIKLQTVAHSPVGYAVEAGFLTHQEAITHEDLNLVSNVVGSDGMHIEVGPRVRLSSRDTVLLGTDGLFDNLHLEEIVEIIRKGRPGAVMADLVSFCRARMTEPREGTPSKPDDLGLVLYRPLA